MYVLSVLVVYYIHLSVLVYYIDLSVLVYYIDLLALFSGVQASGFRIDVMWRVCLVCYAGIISRSHTHTHTHTHSLSLSLSLTHTHRLILPPPASRPPFPSILNSLPGPDEDKQIYTCIGENSRCTVCEQAGQVQTLNRVSRRGAQGQ